MTGSSRADIHSGIAKDRKLDELSLETKENRKKRPDVVTFDQLMGKFDNNAPIGNVIPECLVEPGKNTAPTILMSLGRSGSSSIWGTLSSLTNSERFIKAMEYVGRQPGEILNFFDTTIPANSKYIKMRQSNSEIPGLNNCEHGEWMLNYFCRLVKERPNDLNGFKWKPFLSQFLEREEARETLQLLASLASAAAAVGQEPPIRLIRSRRNALDVTLSEMKHRQEPQLRSHCKEGDEECIKKHEGGKQVIKDARVLFRNTLRRWNDENMIDEMLYELDLSFVSVTYDTLYYADQISDREDQWNKMIQLVKPSSARVTWEDVQNSEQFEATTSSRNHADTIENWEDVYDVFVGTEIEHLLRIE